MARELTQRELRNDSGRIMRELDSGSSFMLTRNGVPVGVLNPASHRQFVAVDRIMEAFMNSPRIDAQTFRSDVTRALNTSRDPRA